MLPIPHLAVGSLYQPARPPAYQPTNQTKPNLTKPTNQPRTPEGKSPHGRPRSRLENSIRMYLRERAWECVEWIHLAQDTDKWQILVNMVMKLLVP